MADVAASRFSLGLFVFAVSVVVVGCGFLRDKELLFRNIRTRAIVL